MPTSTVMLIYEIMSNKYRVESKTQCCGHSWIETFSLLGTGREASYSSDLFLLWIFQGGFYIFQNVKSPKVHERKKSLDPKKDPLSCVGFPIYMRGRNLSSFFFAVMMTLLVIITFSFFGIFFLSCCLVFGMDRLISDFGLISDVAVVEMSFLSPSGLRSLFTQLGLLLCIPFVLAFG